MTGRTRVSNKSTMREHASEDGHDFVCCGSDDVYATILSYMTCESFRLVRGALYSSELARGRVPRYM
jgi:hypothetical protein